MESAPSRPLDPAELARIARQEDVHWWYRGLRHAVLTCLSRPGLALPERPRIVDAGCGTGGLLAACRQHWPDARLAGFDLSPEAVERARAANPGARIERGDLCRPPALDAPFDVVLSMDVLYMVDPEAGLAGLGSLVGSLEPGGLLVLHLPAYAWLRAEHDLAVDTRQRYRLDAVRRILGELDLEVCRLGYRLGPLFPAMVMARLPGILRVRRGRGQPRSDLERPLPAAVHRALYTAVAAENHAFARGLSLPFGSSILAIGRKPVADAAGA